MPKRKMKNAAHTHALPEVEVVHSLLHLYGPITGKGKTGATIIDDAFARKNAQFAKPVPARRIDGTASGDSRANELRSFGQPKAILLRMLRDDPLAAMEHAGQIDNVQFCAGRKWQAAFETSQLSDVKAIDFTKEAVDGGRLGHPLDGMERRERARHDLDRASNALGENGDAIVRDVLGFERMTLAMVCDKRGLTKPGERRFIGRRFRECLDTLAVVFGLVTASGTSK